MDDSKREARDIIILGTCLVAYGVVLLVVTRTGRKAKSVGINFDWLAKIRDTIIAEEHA